MLPPALIALSPGDLSEGDARGGGALLSWLARASAAGLQGFLLREPALGCLATLELGGALARVLRESAGEGAWFGIHDRAHLVSALDAQAHHGGFRSLPPQFCRSLSWMEGRALGLSTHAADPEEAWRGADYLFHGPVLATPSKEGLLEPIGFAGLVRGVDRAGAPVWAIGGLLPEHVGEALASGARGVAVRGGVHAGVDPAPQVEAYLEAFARAGGAP